MKLHLARNEIITGKKWNCTWQGLKYSPGKAIKSDLTWNEIDIRSHLTRNETQPRKRYEIRLAWNKIDMKSHLTRNEIAPGKEWNCIWQELKYSLGKAMKSDLAWNKIDMKLHLARNEIQLRERYEIRPGMKWNRYEIAPGKEWNAALGKIWDQTWHGMK